MVAAFPLAKIAFIFVKQVSKPLANAVKTRAKSSPFFRNYICMPPAQLYHRCEVRVKMWSMNLGKPVNIPKLNEAQAIEFGAELIGETVIFGIATLVLVAEYVRSSRKEAAKEEERKQEVEQMQSDLKNLYMTNASLEAQVRELVRIHRVSVPDAKFATDTHNEHALPMHLRKKPDVVDRGVFATMYDMVWDAVDMLLPKGEGETASDLPTDKRSNNSVPPPASSSVVQNQATSSSPTLQKNSSQGIIKNGSNDTSKR